MMFLGASESGKPKICARHVAPIRRFFAKLPTHHLVLEGVAEVVGELNMEVL